MYQPARTKLTGLFVVMVLVARITAGAPAGIWVALEHIPERARAGAPWVQPERYHAFDLNAAALRDALRAAPIEAFGGPQPAGDVLTLPMPDGTLQRFEFVESPIMAPELAAKFPEIKTYLGRGLDDPHASVRFDTTPVGFHAQILSPRGAVYIEPYRRGDATLHVSFYKRDYRRPVNDFVCLTPAGGGGAEKSLRPSGGTDLNRSGAMLRTYRLACAADGEYTQFFGGTVAAGMAAIVTAINRVDGIFETEMSIRLVLVADNDQIVYTNPNADPYSNTSPSTLLTQNQANLDSVIGSANYDIGHVFTTGGGGISGLGIVCVNGSKARSETGLPNPVGDAFYVDFVIHEMGHEFGADHSFNSTLGNCGSSGQRNASTAYEPGSGSTIMAYAGICSSDDLQPHSDPYFHSISFDEIISETTAGSGNSCAAQTATGNAAPTVSAGPNYTIPARTPFTLTATGSDPDNDPLTYCWEERDLGPSQTLTSPDNGSSPIFRSFNPTVSPSRSFPKLSDILNNTTTLGEKLPTTSRTMTFRVTVRDNRAGGGGVNTDDMQVTVVGTAGPFRVTSPNTSGGRSGSINVTWDVAGTTAAPINAANVNILLSTDGGQTFPTTLLSDTPNDGSQLVTLPNITTTSARIKIAGAGSVFFDVSDANFSITPAIPAPLVVGAGSTLASEGCGTPNGVLDPGETVTVDFALQNVGTAATTNLVATLLASGGVVSPGAPQSYGAIAAGGGTRSRSFSLTASGICGGTLNAVLQLQDGPNNLGLLTNVFPLGVVSVSTSSNRSLTPISIPPTGKSGVASPYPSTINVAGLSGAITKVTVTLHGLSHQSPDDVDFLLVGPDGQSVMLMSDAGGANDVSAVTLTFDDAAAGALPDASLISSGTYQPSDYAAGETLPAPAPSGPYGSALSVFNGSNPNGAWELFCLDDANPNTGDLTQGWTLMITSGEATCCGSSNTAPEIVGPGSQVTDEDVPTAPIAFTVSDSESAANQLTVWATSANTNLVAPTGLALGGSSTHRTITVTPMTNASGGTIITLFASDGFAVSSNAFTLTVNAVNDPPVLSPIADRSVHAGMLVTFTNAASDPADAPPNALSFTLDPGAPIGANVAVTSGVFTWTPDVAHLGTNTIGVRVTDDGTPNLSVSRTFHVAVAAAPIIQSISRSATNVTLIWTAIPGRSYRVQFTGDIAGASWTNLVPDVVATGNTASADDSSIPAQERFYRVIALP